MTVSSTTVRAAYTGDGSTDVFAYTWKITDADHLDVYVDGVLQTRVTDYTVSGVGDEGGGNVNFVSASVPANGADVVIELELPLTQPESLEKLGPFPSEAVEGALDKLTRLIQRLFSDVSRTLRLAEGDPDASIGTLPDKAARKGRVLAFTDPGGDPEAKTVAELGAVVLSDDTPQEPTTSGAAGASDELSRADHRHPLNSTYMTSLTDNGLAVLTAFDGVDPTGTDDSTAGIQAAVDSGAAFLLVPPGTYRVTTPVEITTAIQIFGPGFQRHAEVDDAIATINCDSTDQDGFWVNADHVIIEGLAWRGDAGRIATDGPSAIHVGQNGRTVTDAAIDTGVSATTLTSDTANFTEADEGAKALVDGAFNDERPATISSVTNSTTVELNKSADNTVSGANAEIGQPADGVVIRNVSTQNQGNGGIRLHRARNYRVEGCELRGFRAIEIDNTLTPDGGDGNITDCLLLSHDMTNGQGIRHTGGGALKIKGCKFLDCQDSILIIWNRNTSAGPLITTCSFERITRSAIRVQAGGGAVTPALDFFQIVGNWFNGGQNAIAFLDGMTVTKLLIVGNIIRSGQTNGQVIRIGDQVDGFYIGGNLVDGQGTSGMRGVLVIAGASNGVIGRQQYQGVATEVVNGGTNVFVEPDYEEGTWTPKITFATEGDLSVAYSEQVATYTKIGRQVHVSFAITTSTFTHSTASGNLFITGLPFATDPTSDLRQNGALQFQGITKTNYTNFVAGADPGQTQMKVVAGGSGQNLSNVTASDMPTGGIVVLRGTLVYTV